MGMPLWMGNKHGIRWRVVLLKCMRSLSWKTFRCHTAPAECRCLRACQSITRRPSERMEYIHAIVIYMANVWRFSIPECSCAIDSDRIFTNTHTVMRLCMYVCVCVCSFGAWLSLELRLNTCCWTQREKPSDEWSLCKADQSKSKLDAWQCVNKQTPCMSRSSGECSGKDKHKENLIIPSQIWTDLQAPSFTKATHLLKCSCHKWTQRTKKNMESLLCTGKPSSLHNRKKSQLWVLIKDLMRSQSSKGTIQRQEAGSIYLQLTEWKVLWSSFPLKAWKAPDECWSGPSRRRCHFIGVWNAPHYFGVSVRLLAQTQRSHLNVNMLHCESRQVIVSELMDSIWIAISN